MELHSFRRTRDASRCKPPRQQPQHLRKPLATLCVIWDVHMWTGSRYRLGSTSQVMLYCQFVRSLGALKTLIQHPDAPYHTESAFHRAHHRDVSVPDPSKRRSPAGAISSQSLQSRVRDQEESRLSAHSAFDEPAAAQSAIIQLKSYWDEKYPSRKESCPALPCSSRWGLR